MCVCVWGEGMEYEIFSLNPASSLAWKTYSFRAAMRPLHVEGGTEWETRLSPAYTDQADSVLKYLHFRLNMSTTSVFLQV